MNIVQGHHIVYPDEKHPNQEVVVNVYKGEHMILTKIQWFCKNHCSKGFIKALKHFILMHEDESDDI